MNLDEKNLQALERWTLILALLVIAAAAVATSRATAFGVAAGAALMAANAVAIRAVGGRLLRAPKGFVLLLLNVKMVALIGLVYLVVHTLGVDTLGFLIGVSVFPVAVVVAALGAGLRAADDDSAQEERGHAGSATSAPGGESFRHG